MPPNEEKRFQQSLSTSEADSLLLNSLQPLSSTRSSTVSSKRNARCTDNYLKGKCRLVYMLDPKRQDLWTIQALSQIKGIHPNVIKN